MNSKKILFNGIPASGKTTMATKLHLALEHLGFETVLLDDEVIKRLDANKIDTLVDFIDAPVTIIVSCNPDIRADIIFWCDCTIEEAQTRDDKRLEAEGLVSGNMNRWKNYQSKGIKIKDYSEVVCELNKKNLTC